jgi:hypothetical protein
MSYRSTLLCLLIPLVASLALFFGLFFGLNYPGLSPSIPLSSTSHSSQRSSATVGHSQHATFSTPNWRQDTAARPPARRLHAAMRRLDRRNAVPSSPSWIPHIARAPAQLTRAHVPQGLVAPATEGENRESFICKLLTDFPRCHRYHCCRRCCYSCPHCTTR